MTSIKESRAILSSHRSGGIDTLRVVGVTAVIAGHVAGGLTTYLTFPWHVPVFFFLTGYLWKDERDFSDEWRNRSRSLGFPYLVWFTGLFVAYTIFTALTAHFSFWREAGTLYGGVFAWRPFTTFWFVSALLFATLLYRMLSRFTLEIRWLVALLGVIGGTLLPGITAESPLSTGAAVTCLVFIVAGQTARLLRSRLRHELLVALVLIAISAILIAARMSKPLDLKSGDFGTPVVSVVVAIALSFGLLVVTDSIVQRLPAWVSQVSTALAVPAMVVVLAHPIVLWALDPLTLGHRVEFVVALLVSWAVGLVAVRTPWSTYLTGAKRQEVAFRSRSPRVERTVPAVAVLE
jgi:acyltransferase